MRCIQKIISALVVVSLLGLAPLQTSAAWSITRLFHHAFWVRLSDDFGLTDQYLARPETQKQIELLVKNQPYLYELTRNAQPYVYYVAEQTRQRKMPAEIALVPMVESNYNPFLYSKRGATGLWQIMPGTASGFGLKINWWYDGRRDIIASTRAALNYLEYLHHYFNDWLLAIAAYDAGEGTVLNAIHRNQKLHKPTDFWSLPLPTETRLYIPKLLAIAEVIRNSDYYGVKIIPVPNKPYFSSITLNTTFRISQIAKMADTTPEIIRKLNPGFRRSTTTRKGAYTCLIPIDNVQRFQAALEKTTLQSMQYADLTRYQVKSGDTLARIAGRHHTTVAILKETNHLKNNTIRIGQSLWIPEAETQNTATLHKSINEDHLPGPRRITHVVKKHDTLSDIAHRYNVSIRQICFWNGISNKSRLFPNQELIIWKPHHTHSVQYTVKRGDTLGLLAQRFGTSIQAIKNANRLKTNVIRLGQHLTIPASP